MKENHLRTCRRPGWFFFSLMLSLNVDELSDNLTTQPINKQKRAQCPDPQQGVSSQRHHLFHARGFGMISLQHSALTFLCWINWHFSALFLAIFWTDTQVALKYANFEEVFIIIWYIRCYDQRACLSPRKQQILQWNISDVADQKAFLMLSSR